MKYEITVKGCLSIGGRKFVGGKQYDEKELGNLKNLNDLVKPVEEPKGEMSVKELEEFIEGLEVSELEALLTEEKEGAKRKSAIALLENKIKELKDA